MLKGSGSLGVTHTHTDAHTQSPTLQPLSVNVTQVLLLSTTCQMLIRPSKQLDLQEQVFPNTSFSSSSTVWLLASNTDKDWCNTHSDKSANPIRQRPNVLDNGNNFCLAAVVVEAVTRWFWNMWILVLGPVFPLDLQMCFIRDWQCHTHIHTCIDCVMPCPPTRLHKQRDVLPTCGFWLLKPAIFSQPPFLSPSNHLAFCPLSSPGCEGTQLCIFLFKGLFLKERRTFSQERIQKFRIQVK